MFRGACGQAANVLSKVRSSCICTRVIREALQFIYRADATPARLVHADEQRGFKQRAAATRHTACSVGCAGHSGVWCPDASVAAPPRLRTLPQSCLLAGKDVWAALAQRRVAKLVKPAGKTGRWPGQASVPGSKGFRRPHKVTAASHQDAAAANPWQHHIPGPHAPLGRVRTCSAAPSWSKARFTSSEPALRFLLFGGEAGCNHKH